MATTKLAEGLACSSLLARRSARRKGWRSRLLLLVPSVGPTKAEGLALSSSSSCSLGPARPARPTGLAGTVALQTPRTRPRPDRPLLVVPLPRRARDGGTARRETTPAGVAEDLHVELWRAARPIRSCRPRRLLPSMAAAVVARRAAKQKHTRRACRHLGLRGSGAVPPTRRRRGTRSRSHAPPAKAR